jgi:hypothetical protein
MAIFLKNLMQKLCISLNCFLVLLIKGVLMSNRWMLVYEDMTWFEVDVNCEESQCEVYVYKDKKKLKTKKIKENEMTKVMRVKDKVTGDYMDIVDFNEMDRFFENNNVIFKNRVGLHKEVRRYIDFSLK